MGRARHTHLHVLSVGHNLLPPHQRFALLVHLPQLVLPVPDLTHAYLNLLGLCKELLHVVSQAGDGVPSGGVVAVAPLLNIPPAIALAVVVVLVVVLLLLVLLLLLLLVALLLLGRVARPAVLLVVVVLAIARSIVLDYV